MNEQTRWGTTFAVIALAALWTGCVGEPVDEDDEGGTTGDVGGATCQSDSDCKGDRICEEGVCTTPEQTTNGSGGSGTGTGAGGSGAGGSSGGDGTLVVANTTDDTVFYFYARYCGTSGWSEDWLGSDVIIGGYQVTWTGVSPSCYDFRAEAQEGKYWEFADIYIDAGETQQLTLLP